MRQTLVRFWSTDPGLSVLLWGLVVIVFVLRPVAEVGPAGRTLIEAGMAVVLLAGVWTVWSSRQQAVLLTAVVVLAEAVNLLHRQLPAGGLAPWRGLAMAAPIGILALLVLSRVFRSGPITRQRIEGAVAVYLLVALRWGQLYQFLESLVPGAFQLPSAPQGDRFPPLLYYSFVTLTTLGYGDIVPVHPVARSLAMVEALVGQLYPAILIARLVSLQLSSKAELRG